MLKYVPCVIAEPTNYVATRKLLTRDEVQHVAEHSISIVDLAGNVLILESTTDDSFVIIDTVIPTLPVVSISSNNAASPAIATLGDTITIFFQSSEVLLLTPVVEIAFAPAIVTQSFSGTTT